MGRGGFWQGKFSAFRLVPEFSMGLFLRNPGQTLLLRVGQVPQFPKVWVCQNFLQLYTRHQNLGGAKLFPAEIPPPPRKGKVMAPLMEARVHPEPQPWDRCILHII